MLHCFTHTVGADTPSTTAGKDTINALTINPPTGAAATTLGAFDVIDGRAGSDTLNIYTDLDGVVGPLNRVQQGTLKNVEIINIFNGNAGIQHIYNAGTYAGTLDASKFVGATQVWQDTNAADVSQLADGVTAGLA